MSLSGCGGTASERARSAVERGRGRGRKAAPRQNMERQQQVRPLTEAGKHWQPANASPHQIHWLQTLTMWEMALYTCGENLGPGYLFQMP